MASSMKFLLILFFACSLFLQGTLGHEFDTCDSLSKDKCAFAVDSKGNRCILEKSGECKDTEVEATNLAGYIETDSCIEACASNREMLGWPEAIPLDQVCATECRDACKNMFDFYSWVSISEGKPLVSLCEHANTKAEQTGGSDSNSDGSNSNSDSDSDSETDHHRSMSEVDSGAPASAPASAPSAGGARPVSEIAASLWGAATSFLDSPSPAAAKAVDSAIDAAANSPTATEAVQNTVNAAASSPAAAGYEDDYSGSA